MAQMQQELKEALLELEQLDKLQKERKKKSGIDYYVPNAAQQRAHKSLAKIILYCGGNRAGKSTFGACELAYHLTRRYPDWYPKDRRFYRPIKAVVVCDANAKIEKVIEPKVSEYLPRGSYTRRVIGGYLNRLTMNDGSTVDFLSSEQDDMAFEGADWDFYWGDEPQKKRKFDAIMRGLIDRGGLTVLTFTPLVEPWMKEKLVDKADGKRIETFIVDTYDNLFDIKGNPILVKENVDEMASMWDDDTVETRIHGKFFHLRGSVYPNFCEVHQTIFDYQYPDPVICVLDPHDRQPHHLIWAVIDRTDDIHVHSEMSYHCTVAELSQRVKKLEKSQGYNIRRRIIDPNFGRKPLIISGRNMIEELHHEGCRGWTEADDAKDEGHLKVKDYLHFDRRRPISEVNKPKLFFHKERVPITIRSIRNYQYEEWVGKIAGERDPKELPKQKETHGADVTRYLCMTNPKYEFLRYRNDYELDQPPY